MIGVGINNHGGAGGGGINKVVLREVKAPGFVPSIANAQTLLNQLTVTVAAGEIIFIYVAHFENNVSGAANFATLEFKNNQASTVFNPGNPISINDCIYIGERNSLQSILASSSTQTIPFGDITGQTVSEALNAQDPAITIQEQAAGYVFFTCTIDAQSKTYLFIAAGGIYGVGELQSTDADFVLVDTTLQNTNPTLDQVLTSGDSGTQQLNIDGASTRIFLSPDGPIRTSNLSGDGFVEIEAYGAIKIQSETKTGTIEIASASNNNYGITFPEKPVDSIQIPAFLSDVTKEFIMYIAGQDATGFLGTEVKKNTCDTGFTFTYSGGLFTCPEFDPSKHHLTWSDNYFPGTCVKYVSNFGGILTNFFDGGDFTGSINVFSAGGWIKIEEID